MKVLILDHYYDDFLRSYYSKCPSGDSFQFKEHRKRLMNERFGSSDAYSFHMRRLGCEADEIVTNDDRLQLKWASENGVRVAPVSPLMTKLLNRTLGLDWRFKILKAQIERYRPDVLFIQERNILSNAFIAELKPHVRLTVCQVASPLLKGRSFRSVDLVLTSLPHFVDQFRKMGIRAELMKLCFDSRILNEIDSNEKKRRITFVGGISKFHGQRRRIWSI